MSETLYIDATDQSVSQPGGTCQNCHQRPATEFWVGEGGTLAYVHGFYESWCKPCALQAQIDYIKKQAAAIPDLERELATLNDEMGPL